MSTKVELDAVWEQAGAFGGHAFFVTVGADGRPHAVSAAVGADGDRFAVDPGPTSRANASERPAVMLLWPPVSDGDPYSLLIDGDADVAEDAIRIAPTSAVLHRVAGADAELPSCVRLLRAP